MKVIKRESGVVLKEKLAEILNQKIGKDSGRKFARYRWLSFCGENIEDKRAKADAEFKRAAVIVLAATVFLMILGYFVSGSGTTPAEKLIRSQYGGESSDIVINAKATYKDSTLEKELELRVNPKALSEEDADELFDKCETYLREEVIVSNSQTSDAEHSKEQKKHVQNDESISIIQSSASDAFSEYEDDSEKKKMESDEYLSSKSSADFASEIPIEISADLELPELSPDGLVEISWHSSNPSRIADDGTVNLIDVPDLCPVRMNCVMRAGNYEREISFIISVKEGDPIPSMERNMDILAEELSHTDRGNRLDLPTEYGGMKILWDFPGKEVPWELIPLGLFVLLALYFGRYDAEEKKMKRLVSDFEAEIPSMTLQLILLLNAGLVVSAAFDELVDKNMDSGKPLYTALASVRQKADSENLPFVNELYVFANATGCRDLIRLSSMILDHSGRGSELADKLEKERAQLWSSRLTLAKARTKEAETKLCFPLMLLLIVLVVISAAPALMTM